MIMNTEKYHHHLEALELSAAQKDDLIHIVAAMMESFVDQAFNIHPVQQSLACRAATTTQTMAETLESADNQSFNSINQEGGSSMEEMPSMEV